MIIFLTILHSLVLRRKPQTNHGQEEELQPVLKHSPELPPPQCSRRRAAHGPDCSSLAQLELLPPSWQPLTFTVLPTRWQPPSISQQINAFLQISQPCSCSGSRCLCQPVLKARGEMCRRADVPHLPSNTYQVAPGLCLQSSAWATPETFNIITTTVCVWDNLNASLQPCPRGKKQKEKDATSKPVLSVNT